MTEPLTKQSDDVGPGVSPAARALRGMIRAYQAWSHRRPAHCRFEPSCSHYAYDAISAYGAARGSWLAARRLARCRPGGGLGYDPVPSFDAGTTGKR